MRIAIVGTGVSGLVCAHVLSRRHDVTVFEADRRPGGHAHTVRIDLPDETHEVDTGFLVYNERNYPGLVRLFDTLGVATKPSDMSFSVSDDITGVEWRGTSLSTMFAQRRNAVRPAFLRMLTDVVRFNRAARALLLDEHPDRPVAGRSAGRRALVVPVRRLVPGPHGLVHLVGRPGDPPRHAGGDLRPVLRQPRAARPRQPTVVADGGRRLPSVRGSHCVPARRRRPPVLPGRQGHPPAGRGGAPLGRGPGAVRPRGPGHPQRPGPAPAVRRLRRSSATSWVPSGTSPTGPPSTPTSDSCPPTAGPGPAGTTTGWPTSRRGPPSRTGCVACRASTRPTRS